MGVPDLQGRSIGKFWSVGVPDFGVKRHDRNHREVESENSEVWVSRTSGAGTQKSPWLVDAQLLAAFIDDKKKRALEDWTRTQG